MTTEKTKMPPMTDDNPQLLVLYDGVCGLCDRTIQTLLAADTNHALTFAALQGDTAAAIKARHPNLEGVDSIVFVKNPGPGETLFVKSEAVLRILVEVGGLWSALGVFLVIPSSLRDAVYEWVARNRYRWFGKYDSCKMPSAETRKRFLS